MWTLEGKELCISWDSDLAHERRRFWRSYEADFPAVDILNLNLIR